MQRISQYWATVTKIVRVSAIRNKRKYGGRFETKATRILGPVAEEIFIAEHNRPRYENKGEAPSKTTALFGRNRTRTRC
jgi:hypothetical protein